MKAGVDALDDYAGQLLASAEAWEPTLSDAFTAPVRRNRHGASSGVRGAAWLGGQS